jgi:heat shock protein HslJ
MRATRANRDAPAARLLHLERLHPGLLAAAALLTAALMVAAAGCGSGSGDDSGGAGGGSASGASLDATSWKLTGWSISSQDPNDFTITAEFRDGRIGGTSAVNNYGGPYSTGDDGSFSVGDIVSTMVAGPEPDMRAETDYLTLLKAARKYAVDGKTLTLSDANGNGALIYTAATSASPGQ